MVRNNIKYFFRNLLRNPVFSLINILSLTIGIACSILIILYIRYELSFDNFHQQESQVYRVAMRMKTQENEDVTANTTAAVGPTMVQDFSGVEKTVRLRTPQDGYFNTEDKNLYESGIIYADSTFFEVFSYKLLVGDPKEVLTRPYSLVISEETAKKLFGNVNPVGQSVKLNNKEDLIITGVVARPPSNSHIQFSNLISFTTLYEDSRLHMDWDGGWQYYTYIKLLEEYPIEDLKSKMDDFMHKYINKKLEQYGASLNPVFQPLKSIYLHSNLSGEIGPIGNPSNIYIFSSISIFILIIACINFMNLTTALSTRRAKEVGIRKVIGARRIILIRQFLGESILLSFIGLIFALIVIVIILPYFNNLIGKDLQIYQLSNWQIIIGFPLILLFVGIMAGSYPALYLSAFKPISIIQGILISGKGKSHIRNILVLLQFIISIGLIICTSSIYNQLNYIKKKDLGFDNNNILLVPLVGDEVKEKFEIILTEFKALPGIINASVASDYPGHGFTSNGYIPEGQEKPIMINVIDVDYDFLNTMGLEISKGRNFSGKYVTDRNAYLVNETLVKKMNWEDPIGKKIARGGDHEIIGVVKDFHFATLYEEIAPLIFTMKPYMGFDYITVKLGNEGIASTLKSIEKKWRAIAPNEPFDYLFLDDEFKRVYRPELRFSKLLFYFTILAIGIACMGLFGLASFITEQRTKEVGIRKAMGATSIKVVSLFSKDFTRWVLISNLFAWPVAFYFLNKWLQNFAYRIQFPFWIFLVTSAVALLIAFLTVSYQSFRAANINPAESLRHE